MKFQTYTEQVPLNTQNGQVQGMAMPKGFDAGAGSAALAKGLGIVADAYDKRAEEDDKLTLMKAMNDLDKQRYDLLNNDQNGLLNTQMDGSAGITDTYNSAMEKATADVQKNYKFKTNAYKIAFNNLAAKANQQGYEKVDRYEYQQKERAGDAAYNLNMENKAALMQKNFRNPVEIENVLQDIQLVTSMRYPIERYGAQAVDLKIKQETGKALGAGIVQAITEDDIGTAKKIFDDYNEYLTPDQRTKYTALIKQRGEAKRNLNDVDAYYKRYGGDVNAIKAALDGATEAAPIGDKESFFHAVAMQESGGDYTDVNSRTGAFGKYQIMPDNWPSWSKEAGLPEGSDMTDPANQEKVARYKLGQYYDKYGAEGALVAWYAGEANAKRWVDGAPDAIGEGGHYSWDARQGKGDEPSIREYVHQALSKGGNVPMTEERKQKILNGVIAKKAQEERLKTFEDKKLIDSCWNEFYSDALKGVPYEQVQAKVNKYAAGDGKKYDKLMNVVANFYKANGGLASTGAGSGKALSDYDKQALAQLMYNGEFGNDFTKGLDFVSKKWPGNLKAINTYKTLYDQKQAGQGIFNYNMDGIAETAVQGLVKSNDPASKQIKRAAKTAAIAAINEYRDKNNGKDPSFSEVVAEVRKGIPKIRYGTYVTKPAAGLKWWDSEDTLELSPNMVRDAGIDTITPVENSNMFTVRFRDGHIESMSGDMIRSRVEGEN